LLPLLLTSCGDLPEPFLGNPGSTAQRLAVPVTPLLVVPPPSKALLTAPDNGAFADLLADSLVKEDVPSLAREAKKGDWRLEVTATRAGEKVVPRFAILDPAGKETGAIDGAPASAPAWIAGAPWTLGQVARDAVPKVLALMTSAQATRDRANPGGLLTRTAHLYVPEVAGAPGDGNVILTRLMRARLAEFGPLVQVTPEGADLVVHGVVTITNIPNGQQRVEVVWTVVRPNGEVTGKVSQLNNVPAGMLDHVWGDVAGVVTQEASAGINEVVERFIGRDDLAPATPVAPPGAAPGGTAANAATATGAKPAMPAGR
jgi:hypothetical protein